MRIIGIKKEKKKKMFKFENVIFCENVNGKKTN